MQQETHGLRLQKDYQQNRRGDEREKDRKTL